ncbi:unnamed protein product [Microthlaspi erraticum]|uniref:C2H2-type domain-containing protein n=1 Tax=Microthlaspi erraticum TaxID=1685480 RepID=A0A6D2KV30_9BRAS|nr:unnamed protein product [Microthlaspi erraticum]
MSPSLHACRICGKKFATPKGVYGHQRIHYVSQRIWGFKESRVCSISTSAKSTSFESESHDPSRRRYKATSSLSLKKASSFMTETEQHEMNEAAMSLVMLSERLVVMKNLPPGDDVSMDLEVKPMQETIIGCAESKQEAIEVLGFEKSATCSGVAMDLELKPMQETHIGCVESKQEASEVLGFEKSATCSDVVAQALPSPVRSSLQTKPQSNCSYRFKICGKSFRRSQALSGHQTLQGSVRELLARKRTFEHGDSMSGSPEAKKVVLQPSCSEFYQEDLTGVGVTNVKGHCVEPRQEFSEVFSHSGLEKSSTWSDDIAQPLPSPLRCNLQKKTESASRYKCKICGESFKFFQALGGHQRVHRSIRGQLARGKENFEGGKSLFVLTDSGAKKLVPKPSSCFEVSREELTELRDTNVKEHCLETKHEFSEVFSHSGFEKSGTCSDVAGQALLSPLKSKLQTKPQSNSSYNCKICGKSFVCFQALGGHQKLHRSMRYKLAHKKRTTEGVIHCLAHQPLKTRREH